MKPETKKEIERIEQVVRDYFDRNYEQSGLLHFYHMEEAREHIIRIGTSILCTRAKIGYPGGDFVQAVVNNDLMGAMARADSINRQALFFYCMLIYNASY